MRKSLYTPAKVKSFLEGQSSSTGKDARPQISISFVLIKPVEAASRFENTSQYVSLRRLMWFSKGF